MFLIFVFCIYLCSVFDVIRGVAQLASALAWGARGRKFESFHPDTGKRLIFKLFSVFKLTNCIPYLRMQFFFDFQKIATSSNFYILECFFENSSNIYIF